MDSDSLRLDVRVKRHHLQRGNAFIAAIKAGHGPRDLDEFDRRIESIFTLTDQIIEIPADYRYYADDLAFMYIELLDHANAQGQWGNILDYWLKAIHIGQDIANPVRIAHLWMQRSTIASNRGDVEQAEQGHLAAIALLRRVGTPEAQGILARDLFHLGAHYLDIGQHLKALAPLKECIEICQTVGDDYTRAYALIQLGQVSIQEMRFDEAQQYHNESLAIWEKLGEQGRMAHTSWYALGKVYLVTGRFAEAADAFQRSLDLKKAADYTVEGIANTQQWLGLSLVRQGLVNKGEAYLGDAHRSAVDIGDRECEVNADYGLALADHTRGDTRAAMSHLNEAMIRLQGQPLPLQQIRTMMLLLRLHLKQLHLLTVTRLLIRLFVLSCHEFGIRTTLERGVQILTRQFTF